jgi:integrase/recombinase XerD
MSTTNMSNLPALPAHRIVSTIQATRADSDETLLQSWLASLNSPHTRRNFETTARRFLAELPALGVVGGLRAAKVEDVRDAIDRITAGIAETSAKQHMARVKSLLSYGHKLGYLVFNAGTTIKVRSEAGQRGAQLAQRIIGEAEVTLLLRAARGERNRAMLETLYAGGLRVSELVALTWSDVIARDANAERRVQLNVLGKGGVVRQVLLPAIVSKALLALRGDAGANDPVFASRKGGGALTTRRVHDIVRRTAWRAGIEAPVSPHWLRHAHASHAIDRQATLPEVQRTLGHSNVATTSQYLHARPDTSSGLRLDPAVFGRRR